MRERGQLTVRGSLLERNQGAGIDVNSADATVETTVVRDTQLDPDEAFGRGINIQYNGSNGRARLTLRASLIERNHDTGVFIGGSDATIEATVVRGTQARGDGKFGRGVAVQSEAAANGERGVLSLRGSLIEGNRDVGVVVLDANATIETTVIGNTELSLEEASGYGVAVANTRPQSTGGRLTLRDSLVENNVTAGVMVFGAEATIETSVVRETRPNATGQFGRGINIQSSESEEAGRLTVRGCLVERNYDLGVSIEGADAAIESSLVRATGSQGASIFGDGIFVITLNLPASATISATLVESSARAGLLFVDSTGLLSGVHAAKSRFGLVLQGERRPTLGEANLFEGNADQNTISGGDLKVPDTPPPLP